MKQYGNVKSYAGVWPVRILFVPLQRRLDGEGTGADPLPSFNGRDRVHAMCKGRFGGNPCRPSIFKTLHLCSTTLFSLIGMAIATSSNAKHSVHVIASWRMLPSTTTRTSATSLLLPIYEPAAHCSPNRLGGFLRPYPDGWPGSLAHVGTGWVRHRTSIADECVGLP